MTAEPPMISHFLERTGSALCSSSGSSASAASSERLREPASCSSAAAGAAGALNARVKAAKPALIRMSNPGLAGTSRSGDSSASDFSGLPDASAARSSPARNAGAFLSRPVRAASCNFSRAVSPGFAGASGLSVSITDDSGAARSCSDALKSSDSRGFVFTARSPCAFSASSAAPAFLFQNIRFIVSPLRIYRGLMTPDGPDAIAQHIVPDIQRQTGTGRIFRGQPTHPETGGVFREWCMAPRQKLPDDPYHFRYLAQAAHDVGEVQAVVHFQREMQRGVFAFVGETDVLDVGFRFGDRGSHFRQHAALVGDHQLDGDI